MTVPEEWTPATLGDLASVRRGASPRPIQHPRWFNETGPGWVRIVDVTRSDRYLRETEQRLSPLGVEKSVPVHPGDLIMSICATIGRPMILDMEACIHDGFVLFDKLSDRCDREFLYYIFGERIGQVCFPGATRHTEEGGKPEHQMAFEGLARTLHKPFYLKHLLVAVDVLAYIFTPICSVP